MRVFVTGAAGFIGSTLVPELIQAGYQVTGLARNEASAEALRALGAQTHFGHLEDLESLRSGAAASDGVIHTAFIHDFSKFKENCEIDRRAVGALSDAIAGSGKLLIVTSGTGIGGADTGRPVTEDDAHVSTQVIPRAATEEAAAEAGTRGVRVAVVRLPQVHDTVKQGFVSSAIQIAREKGVSAYIGEGQNRWPASHRIDTAHLYRLALEKNEAGVRYHAVAEEGVPLRDIAEAIGRGLKIPVVSIAPEVASRHFGWLAHFAAWDIPASSIQTRQKLGWQPAGPTLLSDLNNMRYF